MLVVLVALGHWQGERLVWKQNLQARIEARQNLPPLKISNAEDIARLTAAQHDYRRATIEGKSWQQAVFWFARLHNFPTQKISRRDTIGYHVLVPLELADESIILLDAGFIPQHIQADYVPPIMANPQVILRWPAPRALFDAPDEAAQNLFYVRDPVAIGRHWGLVMPDFIGEKLPNTKMGATQNWPQNWSNKAAPIAGQTRLTLPNRHFDYMLTWYGLAVVLVFISGLWHMVHMRHVRSWINRAKG